jgi:hypothetical protein
VTSQGVIAMEVDKARNKYSVERTGLLVGFMSDSYNCLGGAQGDICTGDLPKGDNGIIIVSD